MKEYCEGWRQDWGDFQSSEEDWKLMKVWKGQRGWKDKAEQQLWEKQEVKTVSPSPPERGLLFKSDVAQVSVINPDDTVILLEQSFTLRLSAPLQPLH